MCHWGRMVTLSPSRGGWPLVQELLSLHLRSLREGEEGEMQEGRKEGRKNKVSGRDRDRDGKRDRQRVREGAREWGSGGWRDQGREGGRKRDEEKAYNS